MKKYNGNVLVPYIRARYSVIYLISPEEGRAEALVAEATQECSDKGNLELIVWSHTEGLQVVHGKKRAWDALETSDPIFALLEIQKLKNDAIIVFRDLHPFLEIPKVRRLVRDIARDFKTAATTEGKILRRTLIAISPEANITEDLRHDVTVINFELPDEATLKKLVDDMLSSKELKKLAGGDEAVPNIVEACKGLTTTEASDALAKSIVIRKNQPESEAVAQMVMEEKANALKKTGILEYYHTQVGMDKVGGLDVLKEWLDVRRLAFSDKAKEFGLPAPRGILMAGVPGCGKSLAAKATAAKYDIPLIRFDMGRIFGGLVGQSEANMRTAIQTAEAVGRCVLWVDEIDKAFAGMMSGSSGDSGVSQRVFGNFITWMQEKTVPAFIVATANRIEGLPPELMRKGRFDEIFFVDLPSEIERAEIFRIHVAMRRPKLKLDLGECVRDSQGFSGAEIEEAVISAMYRAFHEGKELNADLILAEVNNTNPLSKTRETEVEGMRSWAKTNAVNASIKAEPRTSKKTTARLAV